MRYLPSLYFDLFLEGYTRKETTEHRWRFEAVQKNPNFSFGSKCAFCSDIVIELVKKDKTLYGTDIGRITGLESMRSYVKWYTDGRLSTANSQVQGIYLLHSLPYAYSTKYMRPMELAMCMPCIGMTCNPHPGPPRVDSTIDRCLCRF